jgi:parvulin-like peptidyl-prolyl isomerase
MKKINIQPKILIIGLLVFIAVYLIFSAILVYGFSLENNWLKASVKNIPYPAALINFYHPVTFSELQKNLNSVKSFYENQDLSNSGFRVDFSTPDGKKRLKIKEKYLLNKLIENKIVAILAKERGVKVTNAIVAQEIETIKNQAQLSGQGEEDGLEKLSRLYGWSVPELEERVIKPDILRKKLEEVVREKDEAFLSAQSQITQAQEELAKNKTFAEVAAKYSEGESAKNGGELGWFAASQMIPEIALTCLNLEKGATSAVIESPLGFHIIQLTDKKTEGDAEKFKIKQIFVKTPTFSDWFFSQEKNFSIQIWLKDFYWDKEKQMVEFRDPSLRDFEEYLRNNFPGDISVLF